MSGITKLPEMLIGLAAKHSYFGDMLKVQMLSWEFGNSPPSYSFAPAIGLIDAAVEKAGGDAKEVFFAGLAGEDDFESLKEMAAAKSEILFPGVLYGWESKEKALEFLGSLEADGRQRVIYKANTKVVSAAAVNLVCHRMSATVESHAVEDNINVFELKDTENPLKEKLGTSVAEWKGKVEAALEAAAAAAAAATDAAANPPAEEEKKEGEGEGEEKKEGEGEGEEKKDE